MAKQIIVLNRHPELPQFRVAFWVPIPAARQPFYVDATKASEWKGASTLENQDLQAGKFVEVVETIAIPNEATIPQMQAIVFDRWTSLTAEYAGKNEWARYGTYYDGTTWTPGGVA